MLHAKERVLHAKERITVTLDPDLLRAAQDAVAEGRAASVSAWVSLALGERANKERRLQALAEAVTAYEVEHGAISPAEIAAQARADRGAAVVVRGGKRVAGKRPKRKSGA
jgi:Arc/MetJ-type ribon-helix-helix transcriptional regulator